MNGSRALLSLRDTCLVPTLVFSREDTEGQEGGKPRAFRALSSGATQQSGCNWTVRTQPAASAALRGWS